MLALAQVVHLPAEFPAVGNSKFSAANTPPDGSVKPHALVPPVTSTVPSGRMVALVWRRRNAMGATAPQVGLAAARSIISAEFCGKLGQVFPPPPRYNTSVSNITAEP